MNGSWVLTNCAERRIKVNEMYFFKVYLNSFFSKINKKIFLTAKKQDW